MARSSPQSSDDDDEEFGPGTTDSTILELASALFSAETAQDLRRLAHEMTDGDTAKVDEAFAVGVEFADALRQPITTDGGETPYDVRELVTEVGDTIGLRVTIDIPPESADPFTNHKTLLVRTPERDIIITSPFPIADVVDKSDPEGTVTEYLLTRASRRGEVDESSGHETEEVVEEDVTPGVDKEEEPE